MPLVLCSKVTAKPQAFRINHEREPQIMKETFKEITRQEHNSVFFTVTFDRPALKRFINSHFYPFF